MKLSDRKKQLILDAAVECARARGYEHITRVNVALAADVAVGSVNKYFATIPQLKRAVMRAAIQRGILEIVAQGLTSKDRQALLASDDLKRRAVAQILC